MNAGAEIIWVLEQDNQRRDGTAARCMDDMDVLGDPSVGWCVGDEETRPTSGAFDDSEFSIGRGFDMIVPLSTMEIVYTTSHGTVQGNENLTGDDVLREVRRVIRELEE